jgi:5-hydroxyisourate hydrolase
MPRLSTHVLDTARGTPAVGVAIELHRLRRTGDREPLGATVTNADGRTDEPLLAGDLLETGVYELVFHAGDYLRGSGLTLPNPPFFDQIVIRFGIGDGTANYHVPLLLAPHGYTTYRGS